MENSNEMQVYGVNLEEYKRSLDSDPIVKIAGMGMVAVSLLSDAQALMEMGQLDEARKLINRAKWVIFTYKILHFHPNTKML